MKRIFFVLVGSSLVATFFGASTALAYTYPPGSPMYEQRKEEAQVRNAPRDTSINSLERQYADRYLGNSARVRGSAPMTASAINTSRFDRSAAEHAGAPYGGGKGKGPLAPTGFGTWMLALLTMGIGAGWYNERLRRTLLGAHC